MNLRGSTCFLTATIVAISLLLLGIAKAQIRNYPAPNCPDDVATLGGIQKGSRPTMLSVNPVIEVEFLFDFGCHGNLPLTRIDQGVRLEFRLQSAGSSNTTTGWIPIRYYAPSLGVPNDNTSLVELDPSNVSVTAQASIYSSTFPLIFIEPSRSEVLIREYICIPYEWNFTENLNLHLRWMQKFGIESGQKEYAWILNDMNIRIWNGTWFLEILNENFSDENFNFDIFDLENGRRYNEHCQIPINNGLLVFEERVSEAPTMRFFKATVANISVSYKVVPDVSTNNSILELFDIYSTLTLICNFEGIPIPLLKWRHNGLLLNNSNDSITITTTTGMSSGTSRLKWVNASMDTNGMFTCVATNNLGSVNIFINALTKTFLYEKFRAGISPEMAVQYLLDTFGEPLPQAISYIVISAVTDILTSISSETDPMAGGYILEFLDIFAVRGYNSSLGKFSNDIFTFQVTVVQPDDRMNSKDQVIVLHEPKGSISLPGELLSIFFPDLLTDIRLVIFVYNNLSGILPEDTIDGKNNTRLGSPVLSASVWCTNIPCDSSNVMLNNPIKLEINHFEKSSDNEVSNIYFFDLQKNLWSNRSCTCNLTLSTSSFSVCQCFHLTHFAILLSPGLEVSDKNKISLTIIGYVGVSFSVFCMIATIFSLTFLRTLWGMRTYIHINLCVCLIISQVIFISAIDKNAIKELCQAIAIVLHYFFLTVFMWMLMEGVLLYVILVIVFIKRQYLYMVCFTVVSYGLPALYVFGMAVPLGLTIKDDQGPLYGSSNVSEACWLRYDKQFIWAFISPVIVIIIINIGFFIMAISIMWKHERKGTDQSKLKITSHWLKTIISLVVVMGITWVIGILVFDEDLIFIAYIFTIAMAFQGVFIFILFVVLSKQVNDQYRSWWRGKKGESKFLHNFFSSSKPTQSNSSSQNKRKPLTQTTFIGKDAVTSESVTSEGFQLKKIKIIDSHESACKFEDGDSANFTIVDHRGNVQKFKGNSNNQEKESQEG